MDLPCFAFRDPIADNSRVFDIARKPVYLLAQNDWNLVRGSIQQHLIERLTDLFAAGGFRNPENLGNRKTILCGVLSEQLLLSVERVAGFLLLF